MYAFVHEGSAFGPEGVIRDVQGTPLEAKDVDAYNKAVETQEIEHLKAHPGAIHLYVKAPTEAPTSTGGTLGLDVSWKLTTWLGTVVCPHAKVGRRVKSGFGNGYRRPLTATIYGQKYHGWYFESSGSYCRLRKAKR